MVWKRDFAGDRDGRFFAQAMLLSRTLSSNHVSFTCFYILRNISVWTNQNHAAYTFMGTTVNLANLIFLYNRFKMHFTDTVSSRASSANRVCLWFLLVASSNAIRHHCICFSLYCSSGIHLDVILSWCKLYRLATIFDLISWKLSSSFAGRLYYSVFSYQQSAM